MLELISHPVCPFVHRTAAFLTHHNVSYTTKHIDLQAKPDWFLAISPRGKVPVLVVDGTPIFESAVILEYAAERFAPKMMPSDPLERARQRMWVEMSTDVIMGQYKIMVATSQSERDKAIAGTRDTLKRFEQTIKGAYFAGEAIGLVDFSTGPGLVRLAKLDAWLHLDLFRDLPKVAAWTKTLASLPAFSQTMVADFDQRLRDMVAMHDVAA
jgi:glutathione S-transferase